MDTRREAAKVEEVIKRFFFTPTAYNPEEFNLEEWRAVQSINKATLDRIFNSLRSFGFMLAGGSINSIFTDEPVNDLDFYLVSHENHNLKVAESFLKEFFPIEAFRSNNAVTLQRKSPRSNRKYTVQLISAFTGPPNYILGSFDFTICMALYDFRTSQFHYDPRFFQDLARRKIVYSGRSEYPICAMYRTLKYQKKGYILQGATIMHIALAILRLEIKTYGDLKKQLMGIDTMYLQGLLRREDYRDDLPVDYAKFVEEAFEAIDGVSQTLAEIEDEEIESQK